ncbi:FAD binding domain-containing protein [soil metagenome]
MSQATLTFTLNSEIETPRHAAPTMTLLEYLRATGRIGTKEGCGDGDCGACTVALVGTDTDGKPHYQAVNSCLLPLGSVAGRAVVTVEGVAGETLHPVQQAMVDTGGSQCGYCTPGFVMSLFAGYYDEQLNDGTVEGNLCRCTGYLPIRRAARSLGGPADDDPHLWTLDHVPPLEPLAFENEENAFFRPSSLDEVFGLLQTHPDAVLIAGGTDLGLELSHHSGHFPCLVSLEDVEELKVVKAGSSHLEVGAGLPLSHIENKLRGIFPALDTMLHWFAARQIRNRATLGGNLGTASPIGDLAPVLLALDAELRLRNAGSEHLVPLAKFFTGYRQTLLQKGEVIVSVLIPQTLPEGAVRRLSNAYKVGKRGTYDISIVAAAFTVDLNADGRVVQARLAYGGVAATPVRATAVEAALVGKLWNDRTVQEAKKSLQTTFKPLDDLRASAAYRNRLVGNLFEKFYFETQEVAA